MELPAERFKSFWGGFSGRVQDIEDPAKDLGGRKRRGTRSIDKNPGRRNDQSNEDARNDRNENGSAHVNEVHVAGMQSF
jgi:ATP-dependent protease ClpP protease subunit